MRAKTTGSNLSRKGFLKLGSAGLAGATMLGAAGCEGSSGSGDLIVRSSGGSPTSPSASRVRRQILPGPIQAATYKGKIWAVPWYTDAGLLYYGMDLLEKSGYYEPP
jgi:hypothetical protein